MDRKEVLKVLIDQNRTQTEMARDLGMTRQNLHRILSGQAKRNQHEDRILKYVEGLNRAQGKQ